MAHACTPGLRVTDAALVRRERRLPLKGRVLAKVGDTVRADQIVAGCELPGNVQTVNLSSRLALDPARVPGSLLKRIGAAVPKGDRIADPKSLFGMLTNHVEAPADGTLESVSNVTGQLILREPPIPVEVAAYLDGTVREVLEGEGVVVESRCAFL